MMLHRWVSLSFILSVSLLVIAALLRIRHHEDFGVWILGYFLAFAVFAILALVEIWNGKLTQRERVVLTVAILFFGFFGGLLYMVKRRKG